MKTSSLFVCAISFALTTLAHAQAPIQLRRSFGKPVTEVYRAKPDISITVNYDSQGQICDIQLAGNYLMARQIGDKLVPLKRWGRQIHPPVSLIGAMDCCESWAYEYEKLIMTTSWGMTPAIRYVFKGRECVVKQPPIRLSDRFSAVIITQPPPPVRGAVNSVAANRIYRKYETTQPAVIIDLPVPELTPEAVAHPADLGEMIIEAVLRPSGEVDNIVLRGSLKHGMAARAIAAMKKIKFKPALMESTPVSQRVLIKYSTETCEGDRICARDMEILDLP